VLRKLTVIAVLIVGVAMLGRCTKETKLIGTLILQTGQTGDVQNCRVQLFVSSDLTGNPVKEVGSDVSGNIARSEFEFTDVLPGYYYLLAWKDLNNDGELSGGDIVGIHGGTYTPGYGGTQVTVSEGKTVDVGDVVMLLYVGDLVVTVTGVRSNGNEETNFTYSFSEDCNLESMTIAWPDGGSNEDVAAPGDKDAGTNYTSGPWSIIGGGEMPAGVHTLNFTGSWAGGDFDIDVDVNVN